VRQIASACGANTMIVLGRWLLALLFLPGLCSAGVTYQMNTQSFGRLASGPSSSKYSVEGDRIRIEPSDGKTIFIFRDGATYTIDTATRSAQVMRHATLAESARVLDESEKRLAEYAATAPPDRRAVADQALAMSKDITARYHHPELREYRKTDRIESSEGRPCHVWEIWDHDAKWLELCVIPTTAVPGGAEAVAAMRSLSRYLHGGVFAVGIEFGPVPRWSEVEALAGVPVILREFNRSELVNEIQLTGFHAQTLKSSVFEVPAGYPVQGEPVPPSNSGGLRGGSGALSSPEP
jgi:hypothetical protein